METRKNHFLLFFVLLSIPFTAYFLRPDMPGWDTYGFLLLSCQQQNLAGIIGLPYLIFSGLPCNLFLVKAIASACAAASGFFCLKLCGLFTKSKLAAIFIFLSPSIMVDFIAIENETLAYPLLFAAVFLFFYSLKNPTRKGRNAFIVSLLLLVPAGLLWEGAIFYLIAFTLNAGMLVLFSLPAIVIFRNKLIGNVFRTQIIDEDTPFKAWYHFFLSFGLIGLAFEPILLPQGIFFFALGMAAAKFWVLSLPFLLVGFVLLVEKFNKPSLSFALGAVSLFCLVGMSISVLQESPTEQHWQAIDYTLSLDKNVSNDWDYGYWVLWKGGQTKSYQSPFTQTKMAGITISKHEQPCVVLKRFGEATVYDC